MIEALLPNLDRLFVGGALAFSFLKAMGRETGKAPIESEFPVEFIRELDRKAETKTELVLPGDFIVRAGNRGRCAPVLSPADVPVDIGAQSLARLVDFMSSGPIVAAILEREDAVANFRQFIGATDPAKADAGTIRKLYASSVGENAIHGSDSDENAKIEGNFFFSGLEQF